MRIVDLAVGLFLAAALVDRARERVGDQSSAATRTISGMCG